MIRWHLIAFALLGGVGIAFGCSSILGTNDYRSVASELCACEPLNFDGCAEQVSERLAEATEQTRAQWLKNFANQKCNSPNNGCKNALDCFDAPPVCSQPGETCSKTEQCCGAATDEAYCSEGRCGRDEPGCARTFEGCVSDEDCCGWQVGLGVCTEGICFEECEPQAPVNCPTCCLSYTPLNATKVGACIDNGVPLGDDGAGAINCSVVCDPERVDDPCPDGTCCVELCGLGQGGGEPAPGSIECLFLCADRTLNLQCLDGR